MTTLCAIAILKFTRMKVLTEFSTENATSLTRTALTGLRLYFSKLAGEQPASWNTTTFGGLILLVAIWAVWFYGTWGYWGNLTADCGREMYVATVLSEGKTLYRDVWFNFGPAAPYFNSFLFRLFGAHLNVLFWAGSLSALGSAIFLFLTGMRLSACLAGWTAGAVVLCESFQASLFSFPLPYSFAAAYGCLVTCLFLWLAVSASIFVNSRAWIFSASWAVAVAVLLKPEFGASCCVGLLFLIVARAFQRQSWNSLLPDLAAILPASVSCCLVIAWMVSLRGVAFLTQENLQSWPTSYFMKTYGKTWLEFTGFSLTRSALSEAAVRMFVYVAFLQGLLLVMNKRRDEIRSAVLRIVLFLGALVYIAWFTVWKEALLQVFFPQDMVVFVAAGAIAAASCFFWQPAEKRNPAAPVLLTVSALVAIRILFKMIPWSYPIFFNGPVVLSFFLLLSPFLQRTSQPSKIALRGSAVLCCGCLVVTLMNSRRADNPTSVVVPLVTKRGTIRVSASLAEHYQAAIHFMQDKSARGEYVLSVPEDTSLYFLSGSHCPSRVFAFTPGTIAPGKMTAELIHEIEAKNVRYLIWSNRIFWEYGVPRFGFDFDKTFGDYLTSHYRRVGPVSDAPVKFRDWNAYIWERIPEDPPKEATRK